MSLYSDVHPHRCSVDCDRPIQWATDDHLRVLTLIGGKKFIAVVDDADDHREVLLIRTGSGDSKSLGHFRSAKEALDSATRAAHQHGLDHLAFPGAWRGRKARAAQIRALRIHNIAHRPGISCGEAGALIAIGITKAFLDRRNGSRDKSRQSGGSL